MKIRSMLIALFVILSDCLIAANTPLAVKEEFYNLTNYWGKGEFLQTFEVTRQKCFDKLALYDDGFVVEGELMEFFQRYLLENAPFEGRWMAVSGDEMFLASMAGATCHSTNSWFIAAEYAKKLTEMEKAARLEFDRLWESENFDAPTTNRSLRVAAWTRLVNVESALMQTMRATTNTFPRRILRKLPAEEGAMLYTNVLRRAGLVQ